MTAESDHRCPLPDRRSQEGAQEVEQLWADYRQRENKRVPITFASDEQLWLKVSGHTFREFYCDPRVHLRAQLEGKLWFYENVPGDRTPGLPAQWDVGVQLWMEENEFFGCHVTYQEDDYAWGNPLPLDGQDLLLYITDLDAEEQVRRSSAYRMYQSLGELAEGFEFHDRPVRIVPPGMSTHGVFTKAAEIRGLERMCLDLKEDAIFARELLRLVTEKTIARMAAWRKLTGAEPLAGEWCSFPDDSLQIISAPAYEQFVLPCHQRLYASTGKPKRGIHLCGWASQHYEVLHRKLGITNIDGPGPFVDHGYYLESLGPDFSFNAQTDHTVLEYGTPTEVKEMMRNLLKPQVKVPGRFNVVGFVARDTPLPNVYACYEAGRRYGGIGS
ncbi:MAG: hypothetical protein ACUVWR_10660 [Anaerolineae bacterium]